MKKVLSVIGGFFIGIWRWIKETAWVQPLLIVGIIFGVIFAIPSVVDGIKAIEDRNNSAETYYKKYQVSLAGAENSAADKLFKEIKSNSEGTSASLSGQKFFLVFVQKDNACAACTAAKDGFEYLAGDGKTLIQGEKLAIKTIFVDQDTKKDWEKPGSFAGDDNEKSAFAAFLARNFSSFEEYAGEAYETHFYLNGGITETQIDDIYSASKEKFQTPTIFQVDFTDGYNGVSNVFIGVNAQQDTRLSKAQYLADAWNYQGIFGPNYTA